jgi:predicted  nucleic acid-binding Zn-ribbon protein
MAGPTNADLRKQITSLEVEKGNLKSEIFQLREEIAQLRSQVKHERAFHADYCAQHEKLRRAFDGSLTLIHFFTASDTVKR